MLLDAVDRRMEATTCREGPSAPSTHNLMVPGDSSKGACAETRTSSQTQAPACKVGKPPQ